MEYELVPLQQYVTDETTISTILQSYQCPLNSDIERFLQERAIHFEKKRFARTYLVIKSVDEIADLVGYFTIAIKVIHLTKGVSNRLKKIISGYSNKTDAAIYLIGQVGKNYNPNITYTISGTDLMELAIDTITSASNIVGGRAIAVECKDDDKLKSFYKDGGFEQTAIENESDLLTFVVGVDAVH